MIELPEVETLRREIAGLRSQTLTAVAAVPEALLETDEEALRQALPGEPLSEVTRHGRILILHFGPWRLLIKVDIGARVRRDGRHPLLQLDFESGDRLVYQSLRRKSKPVGLRPEVGNLTGAINSAVALCDEPHLAGHVWIVESGQEPLSPRFTVGSFKRILDKGKRRVKFALADERLVAGVGSVYADEALFIAGVRPSRYISSLSEDEIRRIYWSLLQVLQKAIRFGGRQAGSYGRFMNVVGREGQPCAACRDARVSMIYLGGEKTYWCPDCQR